MTAQGAERSSLPEALPEQVDGLPESEWDDPLTRLLLLLEIAERPAWLSDLAARHSPAGGSY